MLVMALASCAAVTKPASNVGATAAQLNASRSCDADVAARWGWQWRQLGAAGWSTGSLSRVACPRGLRPEAARTVSAPLGQLQPDTSYQYRLVADPAQPCDFKQPATCKDIFTVDAQGAPMGTTYHSLVTQPQCDDAQGASETLAAFAASNPAGTQADRRVLCLRPGTQEIGQLDGLKAWTTLTPRGETNGTKQAAVLNGNVALQSPGITIEDVRIVGCYRQAACASSRDKTVDVRAPNSTLRHLDVTQRGGRNHDVMQCVLVHGDRQLTGVSIEFSKIHSCGSESSRNLQHGLYCSTAIAPRIVGNWFYDNEGFGVQLYPDCDGAQMIGNVIAENGGACDVSGEGSRATTGATYRNGFCGFARENGKGTMFPPIHCYGATTANQAQDMVLFDTVGGQTDCGGSSLRPAGTLNADPQFVNRAAYDFRMRNPGARTKLAQYGEQVPGPRW